MWSLTFSRSRQVNKQVNKMKVVTAEGRVLLRTDRVERGAERKGRTGRGESSRPLGKQLALWGNPFHRLVP